MQRLTEQGEGRRPPHLAHDLWRLTRGAGVSEPYVESVLERSYFPYTPLRLRKPDGGGRDILSPEPDLLRLQRAALAVLYGELPVHAAAFAYRPGRSVVECAGAHVRAHTVIRLDLADFFHRVTERLLFPVLLAAGRSRLSAYQWTLLLTASPQRDATWLNRGSGLHRPRRRRDDPLRPRRYLYADQREGYLPQGAPTSGLLSNAVLYAFDEGVGREADLRGLRYTRYSDDLYFSARAPVPPNHIETLVSAVRGLAQRNGFELNDRKTRVARPGARRSVLGLLVDGEAPRVPAEQFRELHDHVRAIRRFGLAEHAAHRGFADAQDLVQHLDGRLSWLRFVEPARGGALTVRLREAIAADETGQHALLTVPEVDEDDARRSLNQLLADGDQYRSSRAFGQLVSFVGRFHQYAPYNAMLVHRQKPGARHVLTAARWRSEYGRVLKPGAQSLIILRPRGPFMVVYDVGDTEPLRGAPALPPEVLNPFAADSGIPDETWEAAYDRTVDNLVRLGIRVTRVHHAAASCGRAYRSLSSGHAVQRPGPRGRGVEVFPLIFEVEVNHDLPPVDRYVTLAHEIAHLLCGHVGPHPTQDWPRRPPGSKTRDEVEAEAVAYMAAARLDAGVRMGAYLSDYIGADKPLPQDLRLDVMTDALREVLAMSGGRLSASVPPAVQDA